MVMSYRANAARTVRSVVLAPHASDLLSDLYPYQRQLLDELRGSIGKHQSIVMQLPTGGGKTIIATALVKLLAREFTVWMVNHRREILGQTSKTLSAHGIDHEIIAGSRKAAVWPEKVKLCSIGALPNRDVAAPDVIVWDECHHIAAKSWSGIKEQYPAAVHIGLTATPIRLDGQPLGNWFDTLICGPSTRALIEQGYLSKFRLFAPTIPDMRGVKIQHGDYARSTLSERMSDRVLVGDVVEHYRRLAPGMRAVAFCVSVNASKAIVDRFNEAGIPAQHVDAKTPEAERDGAIAALQAGTIKVLSNVEVFTEGFDLPALDAVILLRPTRSMALYRQMIGRGLRTAAGKPESTILDHAGLVHEHGLPDDDIEWSLAEGARNSTREGKGFIRRCPECSSLHSFAFTCPECGYEYGPNDRSIDEVYGDLREYRKDPPEGYERKIDFWRRAVGGESGVPQYLIRKGLPVSHDGFIPIESGTEWIKQNYKSHFVGYDAECRSRHESGESVTAIARSFSVDRIAVKRSIKRAGGEIFRASDEFLVSRYSEGENFKEIAKSVRLTAQQVAQRIKSSGLYTLPDSERMSLRRKARGLPAYDGVSWRARYEGGESTLEIAKSESVHPNTIAKHIRLAGGQIRPLSGNQYTRLAFKKS